MSFTSPFGGNVIQPTDVSYAAYTLTGDVQLQWPFGSNGTDNPAARIMNITPNTGALIMPPANQTSVGNDALIRNLGGATFTVKDYAGGTIATVAAGTASYIYLTQNPNTAGVWGIIAFGTGTSSADAATLAGLGLTAIATTLNQSHPVSAFPDAYTFVSGDRAQTKVWSGGSGTATLPSSSTVGDNWFFILKNNGTGTLTINCAGGLDTIDTLTTKQFNPSESAFIICTGSGYVTVGYGQSNTFFFTVLVKPVTTGSYFLTSNESLSIIQEYVGSLTGNVLINYLPVVNLYVISNQTTANGFTLSITAGGNTIAIGAGQQATVFCDGVNFYNANTEQSALSTLSLQDGTAATPSLNFINHPTTGIWSAGINDLSIAVGGINVASFNVAALTITGSGTFTTGVSGGTF